MAVYTDFVKIVEGLGSGVGQQLGKEVDLTDGVNFYLSASGYSPRVAKLRRGIMGSVSPYEDVEEQITLYVLGETRDEALANLSTLQSLLSQAHKWSKGQNVKPVYIETRFGRTPLRSLIVGVVDANQPVNLDPSFYERLKGYQIGPVTIRFIRRGEWLTKNFEVVTSSTRDVISDDIAPAELEFDTGGSGPIDIEIEGFATVGFTDLNPDETSWVAVEQGFLLVSRLGGIQADEAEDHIASSDNFEAVTGVVAGSTSAFSGQGYARMVYTIDGGTGVFERATLLINSINSDLNDAGTLGLFAMFNCVSEALVYRVRGYGLSNGLRVYTHWQLLDFSPTSYPDTDPTTFDVSYNRSRPVFLGSVASKGGFTQWGIEVEVATEQGLFPTPPVAGDRLRIDYVAAVDLGDLNSRVLWVDGSGSRYRDDLATGGQFFKLVFNTGALTLREPETYLETTLDPDPAVLGTLRSGFGVLPRSTTPIADAEILAYKTPLGDSYLQAETGVSVLWFGRGLQSEDNQGHNVPTRFTDIEAVAVDIVYRVFKRHAYLTPV